MSLLACRITGVVMSVLVRMSYYRGDHDCLYLHVVLQKWSCVSLLACRITEVVMSVFACMSHYRVGHE